MTSSVEDMDSLPELSSILEQGIPTKECHQLEKDSSNDEDLYADSSMEGSAAALHLFNLDEEELHNSMAIRDVVETVITEIDCNKSMEECPKIHKGNGISNSPNNSFLDEIDCLTDMSCEEQKFFEHYQNADTDDISSVKCTVCSKQLFVLEDSSIRIHPVLGVLMCKDCREFYSSGQFSKDETGIDEYCRWCAEGGSLICCDTCSNVFCKSCLRRSLGRAALAEIKNGGSSWNCLVCNNLPIWSFRAQSRMVLKAIEENKRKIVTTRSMEKATRNKNDPKVWLPACISEAEKFASNYKSLVTKVGNLWNNESKQLSDVGNVESFEKEKIALCCRKLRRAIVAAQFNLKLLEKKVVRNFKRSYGTIIELDDDGDSAGSSFIQHQSGSSTPHQKRLVLKIKNFREANKKQDFYAEIRDSPVLQGEKRSKTDKGDKNSNDTIDNNPSNELRVNQHTSMSTTVVKPNLDAANDEYFDASSEMDSKASQSKKEIGDIRDSKVNNGPSNKNGSENTDNTFDLLSNSCDNDVWKNIFNTSQNDTGDIQANVSGIDNFKEVKTCNVSNEDQNNINQNSHLETSLHHSNSPVTNDESPRPSKITNQNSICENESVRRELLKNSSSDSDSSDSLEKPALNNPRVKKTQKRFRQTAATSDGKLKSDCAIVIKRITELDSDNKTVEDSDDLSDSKLEEKIKRLADLKSLKNKGSSDSDSDSNVSEDSVRKTARKERKRPKKSELAPFNLSDLNSSESESESKSNPEVVKLFSPKNSSLALDLNEVARKQLLLPSSSDDSDQDFESKGTEEETVKQEKEDTVSNEDSSEQTEIITSTDGPNGIKREVGSEEEAEKGVQRSSKLLRVTLAESDVSENEKGSKKRGNKETKAMESEDKKKKKKRRIHSDSSDLDSGSDSGKKRRKKDDNGSNGDDEEDSKPKRRRRIKQASSSGDGSDSDVQVLNESQRMEGGNKGRKNIKKIIKDKNLQDETKAAAKEEEERRRRIAERQKCYNEVFVGDEVLQNTTIDSLVLDFDPTTKKELVTVHQHLVSKLKPHQVKGVKFMWDACFESLERTKDHPGSGCILAHCMGLGKSLQVVTLVHTVLNNKDCEVNRVLVVCPLSTVLNWVNEFKTWLTEDMEPNIYELASVKTNDFRMYHLRNWFENGGVMILGYDMFRNLTNEKTKRIKPKFREIFQKSLVDPGPDLVICDEGHLLKNENTATSKAMNRIQTKRRIVLTGTPLQNSLTEYHCMIQFVKPNLLGNKREFTNRFANPIKNGQCADSTDHDVRIMKRRAHVLHKMLEGSVQRFDYSVLTPFLPPKHEYVISVRMSDVQIKLYQYYLERCAKGGPNACMPMGRGKGSGLFADFQELGRVWTHPKALQIAQLRRDLKSTGISDSEGSMADFIDDRSESESDDGGVVCLDDSGEDKTSGNDEDGETINGWKSRTRSGRGNQPPPEDELGTTATFSSSWWSQFVTDDDMVKIEHSGKLTLLMDILRECELIGDKVLVFSQSLVSLDLIEEFLVAEDERMQLARSEQNAVGDQEYPIGSWRLNCDYFRLDGSTSAELRKNWCNCFNSPQNIRARLFLISTRAGGLGINLVAANRVIIFDASWNPSHDVQSIFRVYRFGQRKPCYVYRFLAQGTMEEKIYDRQVTKLSLSCRVVDEQQIERHFNSADLSELYRFDPDSHTRRPTPMVPKDRLLAELTIRQKEWIVTYHEHDSLLENKEEEELSEEERKAAWEDFENEKRGVMTTFSSEGANSMGMPDVYGLAGRTVAGIPLANIATMILNSNPGISQDEFLGRLRLTVDQLQNFSVQQAAASVGQNQPGLQQPGDAQRLLMQRQAAAEQLKRQFGNGTQSPRPLGFSNNLVTPGPSGLVPQFQQRSRGRPPIGPHQRVDLYGLPPLVYGSAATQAKTNESSQGTKPPPKT